MSVLLAGAFAKDITPDKSYFLYGYPHVNRMSTGTHDPLYASSLVLQSGSEAVALCSTDLIYITKKMVAAVREKVHCATSIPKNNILISATHTHSGPIINNILAWGEDTAIPQVDQNLVESMVEKIAASIIEAHKSTRPARLAITKADGTGVGGNRRNKEGPIDPEVPVLIVQDAARHKVFAVLTVYCMHPTVLHEDSTFYSSDFPGYTKIEVQETLGKDIVHIYHTGPEGNQSPRHYVKANTFAEAERLGRMLGKRIVDAILKTKSEEFKEEIKLKATSSFVDLPLRTFPSVEEAEAKEKAAREKLENMRKEGAPRALIRTAECDWFGAQSTLVISRSYKTKKYYNTLKQILPAEVQVLQISNCFLVGFPGEMFVEYSLELKKRTPAPAFIIALANGELGGYIVTQEEAMQGTAYEATNTLLHYSGGGLLVQEALKLIKLLLNQ
jgi:hypothetical protein